MNRHIEAKINQRIVVIVTTLQYCVYYGLFLLNLIFKSRARNTHCSSHCFAHALLIQQFRKTFIIVCLLIEVLNDPPASTPIIDVNVITTNVYTFLFEILVFVNSREVLNHNWTSHCLIQNMLKRHKRRRWGEKYTMQRHIEATLQYINSCVASIWPPKGYTSCILPEFIEIILIYMCACVCVCI